MALRLSPIPVSSLAKRIMKHPASFSPQRGFTLLEALVSLLILVLGVLGLASVQGRMLVETRTTNSRARAIQLISDFSERVRINAIGAQPSGGLSPYADSNTTPAFPAAPTSLTKDCPNITPGCTSAQEAVYDLESWRQEVAAVLPNGRASILQVSPRQLQVLISWQANENTSPVLGGAASDTIVQTPLQISGTAAGTLCGASATVICHVDFVDIPPVR